MNEEQEDFAAKLELIEREAELAAQDLPPSTVRDRIQHIAVVAQLLKRASTSPPAPSCPKRRALGASPPRAVR